MASLKIKELRTLQKKELKSKLEEVRKELVKLNAQAAVGSALKSPKQIKSLKKTVARLLTLINEKEKKLKSKK